MLPNRQNCLWEISFTSGKCFATKSRIIM
jgi:hypothetical protein